VSQAEVRAFLERHGLLARRDLGQNFLVDEALADRLAELAGVEAGDGVVEIGTGMGILTRALARRAARVLTLEVDAGLVRALRGEGLLPENVELVHADALTHDWVARARELGPRVRAVANLPYAISGPLLRRLLGAADVLADWSVMLQREVAQRLRARPGTRDYGSLTVLHLLRVEVSRELELSPGCFFPRPKVRSTFLRMTPRADAPLGADELPHVERVVRAAFASRRKTIANSLRGARIASPDRVAEALARADIAPEVRAEALPPEALLALARALRAPED